MRRFILSAGLVAGAIVTPVRAHGDHAEPATSVAAEMRSAATALDAVVPDLRDGQPVTLHYEIDAAHRTFAEFFPRAGTARHGATLGVLELPARRATHELLRAGLSEEGYALVNQVMSLEDVLLRQGGNPAVRVVDDYGIHLFGAPNDDTNDDAPWGWKFEGHHLSLNFTLAGEAVRSTPVFIGVNPVEVREGSRAGLRTFTAPLEHAHTLVASLDDEQRATAVTTGPLPDGIVPRGGAITEADAPGLAAARMTPAQRRELHALVTSFARVLRAELAQDELARIEASGWDRVRFRWRGSTDADARQYFRVEGPTFIIEFDRIPEPSAGGDPNHVHAIWHDPERDYGRDLLSEHYERHHEE